MFVSCHVQTAEATLWVLVAPVYYTADMVRGLPEDGNRYETVHGELLVTTAALRRGFGSGTFRPVPGLKPGLGRLGLKSPAIKSAASRRRAGAVEPQLRIGCR